MTRLLFISILLSLPLQAATFTLYPSSDTYIYESYPISSLGTANGIVAALPRGISPTEISAPGLSSASFFPEFQESDFLSSRIGSPVRLAKQSPTENSYIFKGQSENSYILQRQNEVILTPKDTPLVFEKADFLHTGSLLLSFTKKSASTVQIGYFLPTITSEIRYLLNYEPKTTKGLLKAEVWIRNHSERSFPNSKLMVKVGSTPRDNSPQSQPMRVYAAADAKRFTTERILNEGEIVYDLSGTTSLLPGTETSIPLVEETRVAISTVYKLDLGGIQETFTPLNRVLRFRNTTGKALAAGDIYCITDGILERINHLPVTLQDQIAEVDNGTAFALLGKKLSGPISNQNQDIDKPKVDETNISLRNDGKLTVEIEVRDYVPEKESILQSSHPYSRISRNQILFKLILEGGRETTITYTTKRPS